MKKILIPLFILISVSLFAQPDKVVFKGEPKVGVGKQGIQIEYEILLPEGMKWCDIALFLSTDGGQSFVKEPLRAVYFDIGHITSSGVKRALWIPYQERSVLDGKGTDLTFELRVIKTAKIKKQSSSIASNSVSASEMKVTTPKKGGFLIAANLGLYPQLSYGGMIGWSKGAGLYAKFRSDFSKLEETQYECMSDGTADGGYIWPSGVVQKYRMSVTGGLMIRAAKWLYFYIGAGYGNRAVSWRDVDGNWASVTDLSFKGVAVDAGAVLRFGKFAITVGANNTQFKYTELEAGIGLMF
jgi:hypothetical protein